MKIVFHKKALRCVAAFASVFTMVMSPVAQGAQAEGITKKQIEQFLNEAKFTKRTTYKEFWEESKQFYPAQIHKDAERYFMSNPNQLMPEVSVSEVQNSNGEKTTTLTLSENGRQYTMQLIGEKDKYIKFNNVILTENDVLLVTPSIRRIAASDIKIQKDRMSKIKLDKHVFTGYPQLSKDVLKKMTAKERAMYIINLRQVWNDARKVLAQDQLKPNKNSKSKKTSQFKHLIQLLENEAWADDEPILRPPGSAAPKVPTANVVKKNVGAKSSGTMNHCIVAGFVSSYQNGKCAIDNVAQNYQKSGANDPAISKAMTYCQSNGGGIPCNPYIYSQRSAGVPYCVTGSAIQIATHADVAGSCDSQSPLGGSPSIPFLKDPNKKNPGRYDESNLLKTSKELEEAYKVQQADNDKYVESYLKGVGISVKAGDVLTNDQLDGLVAVQTVFNEEIKKARESCIAASANKDHADKNFWGACDQLQRRFLFVAKYLQKVPGCKDGGDVNAETLKCACPDGGVTNPGAKCEAATVMADEAGSLSSMDCALQFPGATGAIPHDSGKCICDNGKEPKRDGKKEENKYTCDAGFNWKPWLIGAGLLLGGFLLYKWLHKDKKKTAVVVPPVQACAGASMCTGSATVFNPATCACDPIIVTPSCAAPKVLTGSSCACPTANACTPGQQIYNTNTCQCEAVAQPTICPDGVTQYFTPPGSSSCPAPTICWNGSEVYPPVQCPANNEGGSGNNCPSGNCNGGVPAGN